MVSRKKNKCKARRRRRAAKAAAAGKTDNGYIDTGYPFCVSASDDWKLSGDQIFGVSSASRSGLAIALSGNGNILAVSDPRISVVRLFDKKGSEW
jgi:hypothetical protein